MRLIGKKHVGVFLYATLVNMVTWGTVIKLNELKCRSVDPSFALFDKCEMRDIGRNDKEANMVVKLLQIPVTNVTIRLELLRRGQSVYNVEIDGCKYWVNKRRYPFMKAIYKLFRVESFTNLNHSCPYSHDIIVDRMKFNANMLTQIPFGKGNYASVMYWSAYNVVRATITVALEITN